MFAFKISRSESRSIAVHLLKNECKSNGILSVIASNYFNVSADYKAFCSKWHWTMPKWKRKHFSTKPHLTETQQPLWVCDSIGLTLPLELMSYLSPIHPAHVSPRPQSVDVPALDGWLFLPEESWGCQNPCGLLGGSFSDSISWSEWVGKKSLSTMPNGRQEGKQIERRREEEEGRGGGEGEWGNTRGYYWSCAWLLNPHRAAVFQPFPLGSFKQPILLK